MKKLLVILVVISALISCEKDSNNDFENDFVPTDVIVKTKVEYTIDKVFDFINSLEHEVEEIRGGVYYSSLPSDSLQYVLDYLNAKPYTHDDVFHVTGYLHYQTKRIKIFPQLFQINKEQYQTDWLQSMELLQLTEELNEETGGYRIYFHVPEGEEKNWVEVFKTYDFVEWAEFNYKFVWYGWP